MDLLSTFDEVLAHVTVSGRWLSEGLAVNSTKRSEQRNKLFNHLQISVTHTDRPDLSDSSAILHRSGKRQTHSLTNSQNKKQ